MPPRRWLAVGLLGGGSYAWEGGRTCERPILQGGDTFHILK